jgi:hypothetical protein
MAYNTIILKKYTDIHEEYEAAAELFPGNLLEITSAGKVQKHSGAGKTGQCLFAIEDALQGKGIADAYAAGDRVRVWVASPGEIVYARLADEEVVVIGDFVESNGSGQLRKVARSAESWESADAQAAASLYDKHVIGQVLAELDTTSLSSTDSSERSTEQFVQIRIV